MTLMENTDPEKTVLDIKRAEDATGTVWLVDGTRLMVRTVVTGVRVVEGQFQPDGQPIYEVASHTIIVSKPRRN